jgi:branched-chain amino acid transport system ATP-binding protein
VLSVRGLHSFYGAIEALKGVDLEVRPGEIVTLIGANGAGKSTLLMTICGQPRAAKGQVNFLGRDITRWATSEIIRHGVAIAPEGRRIFAHMTVRENLLLGAAALGRQDLDGSFRRVFALFPVLEERQNQRGGTLSGGEQQMLALARALMSEPKLLLLDEPSLGLAPMLVRQIFAAIRDINQAQKVTVLLVEQNAFHALKIARRGYVMAGGRIVLHGAAEDLLADREVRAAYLEGGRRTFN